MEEKTKLEIIKLIAKLLETPLGDQIYAKDIRILLDLIK